MKTGGPTITKGERNERLFKIGCALWGKGEVAGRSELYSTLCDVTLERVSPPLETDELKKIVESIAGRYAPGVPIPEGGAA